MLDNVWRAHLLGLNNRSSKKNVRDIWHRKWLFPLYLQAIRTSGKNHRCRLQSNLQCACKSFANTALEYSVKAYEPIPPFDIKFDIVTGFHTYFNGHRTNHLWTYQEWDFFMKISKIIYAIMMLRHFLLLTQSTTPKCHIPQN
jgi:hypothetical protein